MSLSNNEIKVKYTLDVSELARAATAFDNLTAAERNAKEQAKQLQTEVKKTGKAAKEGANEAGDATNEMLGKLMSMAGKVGNIIKVIFIADKLKDFTKECIRLTKEMEALNNAMNLAAGGGTNSARALDFVTKTAAQLGLEI
jgi:hypothetical protein